MLQVKVMVRVESTIDESSNASTCIVKVGNVYLVTCLVVVKPLVAGLLEMLFANFVEPQKE